MSKIIVKDRDSVEPTIFKDRESRRVISPERDISNRMSLHEITRHESSVSYEVKYPENDEILYILEGEGLIFEGKRKHPIKPGSCVFIPANTPYKLSNTSNLRMLAILSPPRYLHEWKNRNDLVKLEPL